MDPNATLEAIRRYLDSAKSADQFDELCELTEALDNWLSKGGFLPEDWKRERKGSNQYTVWAETTAYK